MTRELWTMTQRYTELMNHYHTLMLQYLDSVIDPSKPDVREEWIAAGEELEKVEKELKSVLGVTD